MKKKVYILLIAIVLGLALGTIFYLLTNDGFTEENEEIIIDSELLEDFEALAYQYILYNSLESVSGGFLIENNIIDEKYESLECYIVDEYNIYEDCDLNEELLNNPQLVLTRYIDEEKIIYEDYYSDNMTLSYEIYNIDDDYSLYSELDNFLTNEKNISISNYSEGTYKVFFSDDYLSFDLLKDNESPVFTNTSIGEDINSYSFIDESSYTTYYLYLENYESVEILNYNDFVKFSDLNIEDEGLYYVYLYAVDAALNYSEISYMGELNYGFEINIEE